MKNVAQKNRVKSGNRVEIESGRVKSGEYCTGVSCLEPAPDRRLTCVRICTKARLTLARYMQTYLFVISDIKIDGIHYIFAIWRKNKFHENFRFLWDKLNSMCKTNVSQNGRIVPVKL